MVDIVFSSHDEPEAEAVAENGDTQTKTQTETVETTEADDAGRGEAVEVAEPEAERVTEDANAAEPVETETVEASEVEAEDDKETPTQRRRRQRREARERDRARAEEAEAKAKALKDRLKQYEPIDPNTADDYDLAVAENAAKALRRADTQAEIDSVESEGTKAREAVDQEATQDFVERVEDLSKTIPDLKDKIREMAEAVPEPIQKLMAFEMERGPEVAYHLANNPDQLKRIAAMQPMQAAMTLGRIESQLSAPPKPKVKSDAPAPLSRVSGGKAASEVDLNTADFETYKKARGL